MTSDPGEGAKVVGMCWYTALYLRKYKESLCTNAGEMQQFISGENVQKQMKLLLFK